MLVDVRTVDEYNSGHADYAINIPSDDIDLNRFDKGKKIFLYCRSGNRSMLVENELSQKDYIAYNVGGYYDVIDVMNEA